MKKLLIAADIFPPESGGPATYSVTLANELVKQGVEVKIVSLNPDSDKSKVSCNLFAVTTNFKPLRYWQYYRLLLKHGKDCDVIYAMGPVNAGYFALRAARKLNKKFVVKVVGDYAWEQGQVTGKIKDSIDVFQKKNYMGKIGLLQRVERMVVNAADLVITPSSYLREMVIGWGKPKKSVQVSVVFNAVEISSVQTIPKPTNELWLVTVARLTPWKGVHALIEAVSRLKDRIPHLRLKVGGDGPELPKLKDLVSQMRLDSTVEFLGRIPSSVAHSYIKAADLFVLNSGYEGMSHVILEARLLNTPVIASNMAGNPELLDDVALFEFNNVEEIIKKIELFLTSKNKPEQVKVFNSLSPIETTESMVRQTKLLLEKVCAL